MNGLTTGGEDILIRYISEDKKDILFSTLLLAEFTVKPFILFSIIYLRLSIYIYELKNLPW